MHPKQYKNNSNADASPTPESRKTLEINANILVIPIKSRLLVDLAKYKFAGTKVLQINTT